MNAQNFCTILHEWTGHQKPIVPEDTLDSLNLDTGDLLAFIGCSGAPWLKLNAGSLKDCKTVADFAALFEDAEDAEWLGCVILVNLDGWLSA
jgi:hypothetical protein